MDGLDIRVPTNDQEWHDLDIGPAEIGILKMAIHGLSNHHERWRSNFGEGCTVPGTDGDYYLHEYSVAWFTTPLQKSITTFLLDRSTLSRGPTSEIARSHDAVFTLIDNLHPNGGMPGLTPLPGAHWSNQCGIPYGEEPAFFGTTPRTFGDWYWNAHARAILATLQLQATASLDPEFAEGHPLAKFWNVVHGRLEAIHSPTDERS